MKEKALYTFKPKGGAYMSNQITLDAVIQNLKDAGCKDDFIKKFILALENNQNETVFLLLREWRNSLLDEIHKKQHKLDCLDYLIRNLRD